MDNTFSFDDLIVFEMANNHQGDLDHGLRIIEAMGALAREFDIKAAMKFQYRDLDTFIHPDFKDRPDVPHIPRFLSTALGKGEFEAMLAAVRKAGMLTMVTPFDEASVTTCIDQNVSILKVASCSAGDWPLLEAVAQANQPTIISTGGLSLAEIDKLVSFFGHRNATFSLMHCVGLYPTPPQHLQLGIIKRLASRYHGIPVGYSGHECPNDTDPAVAALALGAKMLERHVGLPSETVKLNAYSMNPEQVRLWLQSIKKTREMLGMAGEKALPKEERDSLLSLQRGVYAKKPVAQGDILQNEDVFFAMPCQPGQLTSGEFGRYRATYKASQAYNLNEAIFEQAKPDQISEIRAIIHEAKGLLYEARINLGKQFSVELSHHYGLENFRETGCLIINVINREYCKKLIVLLPGQNHPLHRHAKKEETFQVLSGKLQLSLNGNEIEMEAGDQLLVERGAWHGFSSLMGCIFEEISTTHIIGDSYYEDEAIARLDPIQRKTLVETW